MPVKPLTFKGDKKVKKRKHRGDDEPATTKSESQVLTNISAEDPDAESWTHPDIASDLTGPILLVLPTSPPSCLAADANGAIFASKLENIIDGVPSTAEPHDVRQVWVATRVAGMGEGDIAFKGSHGGYLSCDQFGVLRAGREAMGREEGFHLDKWAGDDVDGGGAQDGWFVLKTAATSTESTSEGDVDLKTAKPHYLSAVASTTSDLENASKKVAITIRGDATDPTDTSTRILVRMQARFKPRLVASKEKTASAKISRRELESAVGRTLTEEEVRRLKRARREGTYHEEILDVRVKGKHDKFASS